MTSEVLFHIVEIIILGAPLWYGVVRLSVIFREYPPHLHENGNIRFPKGMEPGKVQQIKG